MGKIAGIRKKEIENEFGDGDGGDGEDTIVCEVCDSEYFKIRELEPGTGKCECYCAMCHNELKRFKLDLE